MTGFPFARGFIPVGRRAILVVAEGVIEFRTSVGDSLAISIPGSEAAVIRHFQERMPYGLYVPDVQQSG
jgi:hypothetical protein